MRRILLLIIPALLMGTVAAHAHAYLDRANPPVGSAVRAAPREIQLWFTQNLEAAFSSATVQDASGKRVDQGRARIDGGNRTLMRVSVRPLPPGTYRVRWRVLSVDTHTTEGSFSFRVGQ